MGVKILYLGFDTPRMLHQFYHFIDVYVKRMRPGAPVRCKQIVQAFRLTHPTALDRQYKGFSFRNLRRREVQSWCSTTQNRLKRKWFLGGWLDYEAPRWIKRKTRATDRISVRDYNQRHTPLNNHGVRPMYSRQWMLGDAEVLSMLDQTPGAPDPVIEAVLDRRVPDLPIEKVVLKGKAPVRLPNGVLPRSWSQTAKITELVESGWDPREILEFLKVSPSLVRQVSKRVMLAADEAEVEE